MSETAEAVAANLSSRRNITIEITNLSSNYSLMDPEIYLESGQTHSPPQPTVRSSRTEVCNFNKTTGAATGVVGVLMYDLKPRVTQAKIEQFVLMFSVPHNFNVYKNWFAAGIYPEGTECNEALYKEMYYSKEQKNFVREEAKGSGITYDGAYLDIKATMSPMGRAIMKVEVWDKMFTPQMAQYC